MGTYPQFVTCSVRKYIPRVNCGLTNKHLQDNFRKLRDCPSNRRVLMLAVMTISKGDLSPKLNCVYKENINMILIYELIHNCSPFKNIYSNSVFSSESIPGNMCSDPDFENHKECNLR